MIFERKWPSVIIPNIQVSNHIITVSSTYGLHPKQVIELTSTLGVTTVFEVKRVLDETRLQVGPEGSKITSYENPTEFDGGSLVATEQSRNAIDSNAGIRAAYAEEPTVALRTTLVDYYGNNLATKKTSDGKSVLVVDLAVGDLDGLATAGKQDEQTAILTNIELGLGSLAQEATLVDIKNLEIDIKDYLSGIKTDTDAIASAYNRKKQILEAADRTQALTYADFGTKNERITQIDYQSATVGTGAGYTARKTMTYVLDGGRYKRTDINWNLV